MADTEVAETTETKTDALDTSTQEDAAKTTDTTTTDQVTDTKSTDEGSDAGDVGQETKTDDASGEDADKGDEASTPKQQKLLGYQLRQIRANDPYVARIRRTLQDEFVNADGLTDEQRDIRGIKADNYVKDVETKRAQLVADSQTIASEFPIFDPNSESFNKQLYDRSLARFGRDSLELDDGGQITGYKLSLLDYMREEADSYQALVEAGMSKTEATKAAKGNTQEAIAKMDAASEDNGGTSPTKSASAVDPNVQSFLDGFDSVK